MNTKKKYTKETEIHKIYGFLEVVDFEESFTKNGVRTECFAFVTCLNCKNDKIFKIRYDRLLSGKKTACYCLNKKSSIIKEIEIGKIYGFLKIIDLIEDYTENGKRHPATAIVICERPGCTLNKGKFSIIHAALKGKNPTLSCGCLNNTRAAEIEIGKIYGFLRIIDIILSYKIDGKWTPKMALVICERPECDLNRGEYEVRLSQLTRKNGKTISCGCYQNYIRGKSIRKHFLSKHPYYHVCFGAIERGGPDYMYAYNYYERGIRCFWTLENISNFIKYLEEELPPRKKGMTLDRIDNNGNYEPGNLRWATWEEQSQNKRARISNYQFDRLKKEYDELKEKYDSLISNQEFIYGIY